MDNGQSNRPDGSPAAREPWSGRRASGDEPAPGNAEGDIPFDERLRRAEEELRAEREAAAQGAPRGYDDWSPEPGAGTPPPQPGGRIDFAALFVLLDALRRAVPPELQERVTALIREALLTLRSLIDWYLERIDRPKREPRVEDIPID
jgi:hypothetical protein